LEYKCAWYGNNLIVANRFFPSSKLCSCCGNKKNDLKLKDRTYICDNCGLEIDRDLNASINLEQYTVGTRELTLVEMKKVHVEKSTGDRLRTRIKQKIYL